MSPLDSVRQIYVPLFIIHGMKDRIITLSYSQHLYESANHPKELWLLHGADHSNMVEVGGEAYYKRILEFFDEALLAGDRKPARGGR